MRGWHNGTACGCSPHLWGFDSLPSLVKNQSVVLEHTQNSKNSDVSKMKAICICGLVGSGKTTVARLLAEELGVEHFSVGRKFKSNSDASKETERLLEFVKGNKAYNKDYHHSLDDLQIQLAKKGDIVIDSKLGVHFLKGIATTIYLVASFENRAKRIAKREDWDLKKAREVLRQCEEKEKSIFEKVYDIDYLKQKEQADLVIDTNDKLPNQIVKEIENFLGTK